MNWTAERLARWRNRPARSAGWRVLVGIAVLGDLAAIAGLVGHYHPPGSVYTAALAVFGPYLGLGALLAVVLFAAARATTGLIGLGVSAVLVGWLVIVHVPLFTTTDVPPGTDLTVMTANLRLGQADPAAVVAAARRHHVDVLMIEELTTTELARLHHAGLDTLLPYRAVAPADAAVGTGLWSTTPLSAERIGHDLRLNYVVAQRSGVALLAVHLDGPYPASQTAGWNHDIRALPAVMRRLPARRALVGGDFNASADVVQFRRLLRDGFADADDQAGAGLTPTYPADRLIPLIAIDHVLCRGLVASTVDAVRIPDTDHRALVVTVRIPRTP